MLTRYLKSILRPLAQRRFYSAVNILGLAAGMACSLLVLFYVRYERSYDRFHDRPDDIYRIVMHQPKNAASGTEWWVVSPYILAETLKREAPDVVRVARILREESIVRAADRTFVEKKFFFADPEFLRIFSFPLIQGDVGTALSEPFTVVLTRSTAERYFGRENPIGRAVTIGDNRLYRVTGVMADVPGNSHFSFDLLASFATLPSLWQGDAWRAQWKTDWFDNPFKTYLRLREGTDPQTFDEKLRPYAFKGFGDELYTFHVQPLTDIHFKGHYNGELEANGDIKYLFIFSAVAVFLMIIAGSNFVNLSTALASLRAKEVGIRKVVGAARHQLIGRFLCESLLLSGLALLVASALAVFLLPLFRRLVGSTIPLRALIEPSSLLLTAAFALGTGLLAGLYPAFVLSAFLPVKTLKGDRSPGSEGAVSFRRLLVVVQFAISAVLIAGTLIIRGQLDFMRTKTLGFQKDHIITLNTMRDPGLARNREAARRELESLPRIKALTESTGLPNLIGWSNLADWSGKNPDEKTFFYRLGVDRNYLDFYGLGLAAGRAFSTTPGVDGASAYLINETAAKRMGMKDPVGQPFGFKKIDGTIIGVVRDFHFDSLNVPIAPLAISVLPEDRLYRTSLKIDAADVPGALADVRAVWNKYAAFHPFSYAFLDESLDAAYKKEERLAEGFGIFSLIAILIAVLGLFGLTAYSVGRRTREISIRKILGAGIPQIVALLARDFAGGIAVACLLAAPITYFVMNAWLRTFAYRIAVPASAFVLPAILLLAASSLTVAHQMLKAATANPARSLRQE